MTNHDLVCVLPIHTYAGPSIDLDNPHELDELIAIFSDPTQAAIWCHAHQAQHGELINKIMATVIDMKDKIQKI